MSLSPLVIFLREFTGIANDNFSLLIFKLCPKATHYGTDYRGNMIYHWGPSNLMAPLLLRKQAKVKITNSKFCTNLKPKLDILVHLQEGTPYWIGEWGDTWFGSWLKLKLYLPPPPAFIYPCQAETFKFRYEEI